MSVKLKISVKSCIIKYHLKVVSSNTCYKMLQVDYISYSYLYIFVSQLLLLMIAAEVVFASSRLVRRLLARELFR